MLLLLLVAILSRKALWTSVRCEWGFRSCGGMMNWGKGCSNGDWCSSLMLGQSLWTAEASVHGCKPVFAITASSYEDDTGSVPTTGLGLDVRLPSCPAEALVWLQSSTTPFNFQHTRRKNPRTREQESFSWEAPKHRENNREAALTAPMSEGKI